MPCWIWLPPKVDKERYSTPALGGKLRGGGTLQMDDVTNILTLQVFTVSIQYNWFSNKDFNGYFCKYTINYGNVDYIFALICILYIWNGGKIMDCAFGLIELTTFTGTFTPTASLIIVNRKDPWSVQEPITLLLLTATFDSILPQMVCVKHTCQLSRHL